MMRIDINSDVGESFGAYEIGNDAGLMKSITSADIGAGFHGGDPSVLRETVRMANQRRCGRRPPGISGSGRLRPAELNVTPKEAEDLKTA